MNFNDFYWHDSSIKNISIDRSNPGLKDIICFEINMAEGENIELRFEGVYWANMALNFGIIAQENILDAFVTDRNEVALVNLYAKWRGALDNIELDCYVINLNSTGGLIKIIAKGFKVTYK